MGMPDGALEETRKQERGIFAERLCKASGGLSKDILEDLEENL